MISKSCVLRIYPNQSQAASLRRWQGGLRKIWNLTLDHAFKTRDAGDKWLNKKAIQAYMVALKHQDEYKWMCDIPAHAILALADDMHRAFKNWFEKRAKRPKFRGRNHRQFSVYMVNQATTITENHLRLPKLAKVKYRGGDIPQGRLLSARINTEAGKWYYSATFECADLEVDLAPKTCGIDMGVASLATLYDGEKVIEWQAPKILRKHEKRLKRFQRSLSRRVKGSNRRLAMRKKIAKEHQKIANIRADYAHKITSEIVKNHQVIKVETLNIKGMLKNHHLAKSVSDAGMGNFLRILKYKADWYGRTLVEADQWFASTKECRQCGDKQPMPLSKRMYECVCGWRLPRDHNAAMNLFAYPEQRENVVSNMTESAGRGGDQDLGAIPLSVPLSELRILKRGSNVVSLH